jgi:hypothetical protein
MSTVGLYWLIIVIGVTSAIAAACAGLSHRWWAWLDLTGSVAVGALVVGAFVLMQQGHRNFPDTRRELDSYWLTRLVPAPTPTTETETGTGTAGGTGTGTAGGAGAP